MLSALGKKVHKRRFTFSTRFEKLKSERNRNRKTSSLCVSTSCSSSQEYNTTHMFVVYKNKS